MDSGLPKWLANPLIISSSYEISTSESSESDSKVFDALGKQTFHIKSAFFILFSRLGIEGLFPFQTRVREHFLDQEAGDLCVSAPTGSGKTLSYVLPVVESLQRHIIGRIRCLVVVPTRDLIPQVEETFSLVSTAYEAADKNSNSSCALKNGTDFLVLTPGRLIDILSTLNLDALEYLIVDEADRLLDQSFQEWLPQLLLKISTLRETNGQDQDNNIFDSEAWTKKSGVRKLLFSATLTKNPAKIAPLQLYRPKYFQVRTINEEDPQNEKNNINTGTGSSQLMTPESLKELAVVINEAEMKPAALFEILTQILPQPATRILCFTRSVDSTNRLTKLLLTALPNIKIACFHGSLTDAARQKLLKQFESEEINILLGSDAMARGLDLKAVSCVINYDLPAFSATYVHRAGRSARAGREGLAVTLLTSDQVRHFKKMMRMGLGKEFSDFSGPLSDLERNRVGKIELNSEEINLKWRETLETSLKSLF